MNIANAYSMNQSIFLGSHLHLNRYKYQGSTLKSSTILKIPIMFIHFSYNKVFTVCLLFAWLHSRQLRYKDGL